MTATDTSRRDRADGSAAGPGHGPRPPTRAIGRRFRPGRAAGFDVRDSTDGGASWSSVGRCTRFSAGGRPHLLLDTHRDRRVGRPRHGRDASGKTSDRPGAGCRGVAGVHRGPVPNTARDLGASAPCRISSPGPDNLRRRRRQSTVAIKPRCGCHVRRSSPPCPTMAPRTGNYNWTVASPKFEEVPHPGLVDRGHNGGGRSNMNFTIQ